MIDDAHRNACARTAAVRPHKYGKFIKKLDDDHTHTEGSRPSFVVPLLPHLLTIDFSNPLFVRFPMEDNKRLITVHIAAGWLKERADRDRRRTNNLALLFNFYRDEIEAAASAKYDRGYCDGADVVVTARDLDGESERLSPKG